MLTFLVLGLTSHSSHGQPLFLLFILGELLSPSLCFTSLTLSVFVYLCFITTQAPTFSLYSLSLSHLFLFLQKEKRDYLCMSTLLLYPTPFLICLGCVLTTLHTHTCSSFFTNYYYTHVHLTATNNSIQLDLNQHFTLPCWLN